MDGDWTFTASDDGNFDLDVSPSAASLTEGQLATITITADVSTSDVDEWFFGEIAVTGTGADMHMPVAVKATRGSLPDHVRIAARRDAGSVVETDVTSIAIEQLTIDVSGLAEGIQLDLELEEDSNNGSPLITAAGNFDCG